MDAFRLPRMGNHGIVGWTTLFVSLALAGSLAVVPAVSSATVTNAWQAKIGTRGVNGTAKVQVLNTGTGSLTLKLVKMRPATLLPVVLHKGTCSAVGPVLTRLDSIRSSSAGAAARTSNLTAIRVRALIAATRSGRIAIRVGSGSAVRCGQFAALVVPTPSPTPTPPSTALPTVVGSSDRLGDLASYRYVYGGTWHAIRPGLADYWAENHRTEVPPQKATSFFRRIAPGQNAAYGLIIIGDRTWEAPEGATFRELTGDEETVRRLTFISQWPTGIAYSYEGFAGSLAPAGTETKNGVSCLHFHAASPNPLLLPAGVPSDWSATMDVWVAWNGGHFVSALWDVVSPAGQAVGHFRMWIDFTNINDPTNAVVAPS